MSRDFGEVRKHPASAVGALRGTRPLAPRAASSLSHSVRTSSPNLDEFTQQKTCYTTEPGYRTPKKRNTVLVAARSTSSNVFGHDVGTQLQVMSVMRSALGASQSPGISDTMLRVGRIDDLIAQVRRNDTGKYVNKPVVMNSGLVDEYPALYNLFPAHTWSPWFVTPFVVLSTSKSSAENRRVVFYFKGTASVDTGWWLYVLSTDGSIDDLKTALSGAQGAIEVDTESVYPAQWYLQQAQGTLAAL